MYYLSQQRKKITEAGGIAFIVAFDVAPFYNIRFLMRDGNTAEWTYKAKDERDKELHALYELKNSVKAVNSTR